MTEDQIDIGGRTLGQWNAYVEAGRTIGERRMRLNAVPAEWRESVRAHVALVLRLKESARLTPPRWVGR